MKKLLEKRGKKAAMELSIGTVVILVLAMTMLILGMVLIRTIMCAGMGMTRNIEDKMEAELGELFGDRDFGVRCMGTPGQDRPVLADGVTAEITCVIMEDSSRPYKLDVLEIERISGGGNVEEWIIRDNGWEGTAGVGSNTVRIAELEIPRDVPSTTIGIIVEEYRDGNNEIYRTHDLRIDIAPAGMMTRTIC